MAHQLLSVSATSSGFTALVVAPAACNSRSSRGASTSGVVRCMARRSDKRASKNSGLNVTKPHAHTLRDCRAFDSCSKGGENCVGENLFEESANADECDGSFIVQDDLDDLIQLLPEDVRAPLMDHEHRRQLLEVVLDLGRCPEARFLGDLGSVCLREAPITQEDLDAAEAAVGEFGGDNRAGIEGTLHRISCIRNRRGKIVGLTCRVGRAVTGHVDMIRDLVNSSESMLFLGRPGVGKTTVIREMARVMSDELKRRVVIIDTSNEIGGDGDVPHAAIGSARRMQVPNPSEQHRVMIEAVENHMPEVIIVDEIGTEAEALACRTIAERGVQLVGTAHGQILENLIKNPTLSDLVGGVQTVTLGDDEARARGCQKSIMERTAPPTFPILIEMHERALWVAHNVAESVDETLAGRRPIVQMRTRDEGGDVAVDRTVYDMDVSLSRQSMAHTLGAMGGLMGPTASFDMASFDSADDPYAWTAHIGQVPDKDALAEMAANGYLGGDGKFRTGNKFGSDKRSRKKSKALRAVKGGR